MIVSELARQCGVASHVVRYYSRIGLLTPVRNPENGYKVFNIDDVRRMRFIRKAQSIGFTLEEIQKILSFDKQNRSPCSMVRQGLVRHIEEYQRKIEELERKRNHMEEVLTVWDGLPDQGNYHQNICHLIERVAI